jgi:hypothetical protein
MPESIHTEFLTLPAAVSQLQLQLIYDTVCAVGSFVSQ